MINEFLLTIKKVEFYVMISRIGNISKLRIGKFILREINMRQKFCLTIYIFLIDAIESINERYDSFLKIRFYELESKLALEMM